MSDLEMVRQELLERGDEMVSFQQLVERFDSIEEVYPDQPWNLEQIYSNFNMLVGEKPKIDIEKDNTHYDEFGFVDPFGFNRRTQIETLIS